MVCLRFLGTSDRSDSVDGVLRFLLRELASRGRLTGDLPADPGELRNRWPALLAEVGRGGPVVLVLDALNQLASGLRDLYWLPREMPDGVKVVVSCKRDVADAQAEQVRESWLRSGALLHDLRGLDSAEERRAVVREFLRLHLKDLDEGLLEQLIGAPGASNPLYLRVVLAELRLFGSFPNLQAYLAQTFGTTPLEAFAGVLKRLESDPAYTDLQPRRVVPLLFGLLAHSRRGLSTRELAELLVRYYPWPDGARPGCALRRRGTRCTTTCGRRGCTWHGGKGGWISSTRRSRLPSRSATPARRLFRAASRPSRCSRRKFGTACWPATSTVTAHPATAGRSEGAGRPLRWATSASYK